MKFKNVQCRKSCNKLKDVKVSNYSDFHDFSKKLMQAVDEIAPYREFRVKGQTEDWFDGEIMERIKSQNQKLTTKFIERPKLHPLI